MLAPSMQFQTQLKRARITYAMLMASTTCVIMSAITVSILTPTALFWQHWPTVLGIDLLVANPVAIILGPMIRRICHRLYPQISQ